tara:strand:- start:2131 stop:3246 length:1116 start_codon:yes stop_codon:yes gene_type:complete
MNDIIPFLNLKSSYKQIKEEIDQSIHRVLESGNYILGDEVIKFEEDWASYCETRYAVGVGNGLDALRIALLAIDIKPGDEVIVPAHTFIATWLAISSVGAIPVPVDINEDSYNLQKTNLEGAISERTKAIIPVHMYGKPCDLQEIRLITSKYNLYIIEDAAQAHGSLYQNKKIGGFGDLTCWSFYPGKNLGALGDGGAITTDNLILAEKVLRLRNYGSTTKYVNRVKGINSRLDTIQAGILNVKLKYLDKWNLRRSEIAKIYDNNLKESINFKKPEIPIDGNQSCWHLYVIQCSQRNKLQNYLSEKGIQTLIHYPIPPFKQEAYKEFNGIYMPKASNVCTKILSLPICPFMSNAMVDHVINHINYFGDHYT